MVTKESFWKTLITGAGLVLFLAGLAYGQNVTAGLRGTVTDASGAVVPDAKVSIKGVETGYSRTTLTDASGAYVFTLLPIGPYDLTIQKAGFKTYTQTGITLTVNQVAGVNATLHVGSTTQKVQVTAAKTMVNTQTSDVSTVFDEQQIRALPLNGRNPIALATLTNGVQSYALPTYLGEGGGSVTDNIDGGGSVLTINGNRWHQTQFNLDGGEFAGIEFDTGLNYPNPDALQEFRLITSNYSAALGRLPGGVMNVVTKSGTNHIHGDLWEFNRNSALSTNGFGQVTKPFLNQNQFGFTAGGPVIKNKVFLFGSGQWLRIAKQDVSSGNFPPTAAERNGNLSADPGAIINPLTNQPFQGNIIPKDQIDPIAAKMLQLIPLPNQPDGTLYQALSAPALNHQYLIKGDYQIEAANRLSVSLFRDITNGEYPLSRGGSGGGLQYVNTTGPNYQTNGGNITSVIANDTHIFRGNLLNHFRFGYVRVRAINGQGQKVGPTMHDLNPNYPNYPLIDRPGIWITGRVFASRGSWGTSNSDEYQFSDGVDYIRGGHNVQVGGSFRRGSIDHTLTNNDQGVFWGGFTSVTGNPLADFMLGKPLGIITNPSSDGYYQNSYAGYVQDNYRVNSRLELNMGLRYQLAPLWTPTVDYKLSDGTITTGLATWRPGQQSQLFPNAPVGVVYANDPGVPQSGANTDFRNWAPRMGFAWDVFGTGKTSLRGGFGVFYEMPATRFSLFDIGAPFGPNKKVVSSLDGFAGFPGPNYYPPPPLTRNYDFSSLYPLTISSGGSVPINQHNAVVNQYNLTLEQQIANGVLLSVAYVGNEGHHLPWSQNLNPAVYIPGTDANGLPLSTESNIDQRRVLNLALPPGTPPVYGAITQEEDSANSNYNALQLQVRTRNFHGLTLQANYTWAKAIDEVSLFFFGLPSSDQQNPSCLRCDRGLADFNRAQQVVLSYVYRVPSLPRALGLKNIVINGALDGWELSGITSFSSGSVFSIMTGLDNSRTGNGKDRANLIGDWHLPSNRSQAQKTAEWFNTSAFVPNTIGTFGNSGRNIITGPGSIGTDAGIFKNFPLGLGNKERQFQVRFEFYNFFNHPNLGNPGDTWGTPGFGEILGASGGRVIQIGGKIFF